MSKRLVFVLIFLVAIQLSATVWLGLSYRVTIATAHHVFFAPVVVPRSDKGLLMLEPVFYADLNRFGHIARVYTNGKWHRLGCAGGDSCQTNWDVQDSPMTICGAPCGMVWDSDTDVPEYNNELLHWAEDFVRKSKGTR